MPTCEFHLITILGDGHLTRNGRREGIYEMKRQPDTSKIGAGIALGTGIGVVVGVGMDSVAVGLAVGIAVGAALGAAWSQKSRGSGNGDDS